MLAVLSALSIHALIRYVRLLRSPRYSIFDSAAHVSLQRRNPKAQPTAVALCLTIIALFASTTTHVVATLLRYQTTLLNTVLTTNVLWSYDVPIDTLWQTKVVVKDYSPIQSCAGTVALTINVRLPIAPSPHSPRLPTRPSYIGHTGRRDCMLEDMCCLAGSPCRQARLRSLLACDAEYAPRMIPCMSECLTLFSTTSPRGY